VQDKQNTIPYHMTKDFEEDLVGFGIIFAVFSVFFTIVCIILGILYSIIRIFRHIF
jgi:hypothetical protein